jgi:hypothetical protein
MWLYTKVGDMVHTVSRSTDVPTVAQAGRLHTYSALIDCTTVDSSIAAGDLLVYYTRIEGYNFLALAQRPMRFGFWVKGTKTGIHCVSFRNVGVDRSLVMEYTINTTNTWEFKEMTLPASPSAGTWDYINGVGLYAGFTLAAGSTYHTTAGSWQTGDFLATSSQVNACDSTSNDFRIAGVFLVPGDLTSEVQIRHRQLEKILCQRYWCKTYDEALFAGDTSGTAADGAVTGVATGTAAATMSVSWHFPVNMRAVPTVTLYSPNTGAAANFRRNSGAADVAMLTALIGETGVTVYNNGAVTDTELIYGQIIASARL